MSTLKTAFEMASHSFDDIVKTPKPDLLIYDLNQPWAAAVASSHNIPAVHQSGKEFPFPEIYLHEHEGNKLREALHSSVNDVKEEDRFHEAMERSCNIVLIKTFRTIEDKYINYLSVLVEKKIVPVGPLVQDAVNDEHEEIIKWLDKKDEASAIFVSFGSEYFLSKEEIEEVAHGLELSKVNFIWVVRFPVGEKIKIEEALPERFLERVGERGRILEGWSPQAKILRHPSTGGFPLNARMVEEVGVGIEVVRDKNGRLHREEIAKVIGKVVVENGGEIVRRKASELREKIRIKGEEETVGVVEELVQLCRKV
ncbi:unnamed protein product [Ilex paraguariensis]|uniref:Uncharacterized protein n=1 Tax=Ilex paraguariensis TaxID=185542 RepID=A0ABC8S6Z5_9AQUA